MTILCSTSIGLILKSNDSQKGTPIILLAGNYFIASIISLYFLLNQSAISWSVETLIFGAFLGILFLISFFAFAKAVSATGAALASVASRLSVIIPISLSIIIFHEIPNLWKIAGFSFTFITIILFFFSLRKKTGHHLKSSDLFYLFAVLMGIGINDFSMKIFQHWRPVGEKPFFLFCIFTFSFIYSIIYIFAKKIKFEKTTSFRGIILGVPNMFSTFFLLGALEKLPAIMVYPITNIGIILFTALGAVIIFTEKINTFGKYALLSGIVAIVFLTI